MMLTELFRFRVRIFTKQNQSNVFKICYRSLPISEHIKICNTCDYLKESSICSKCKAVTTTDNLLVFDVIFQIRKIISDSNNLEEIRKFKIDKLIFNTDSIIHKIKSKHPTAMSLTFNTDGSNIFSKNSVTAWNFFLAINELSIKSRYNIKNIIVPAVYVGHRKLSNLIALNSIFREIKKMEAGFY